MAWAYSSRMPPLVGASGSTRWASVIFRCHSTCAWLRFGSKTNTGTSFRLYKASHRFLNTGRLSTKPPPSRPTTTNATTTRVRGSFSSKSKIFTWYTRQQKNRPYITEICSTIIVYCIGDFAAQALSGESYDPSRTIRSIAIGSMAAIPTRMWFLFLSRNFNFSSTALSICTKVVINQLVYTTLFNVYFFAAHAILSGKSISGVVERVKDTVPISLPRSLFYWPFVTAFNFTYVQPQSRSIVTAVFSVFWQAYMSWLNARVQKQQDEGQTAATQHDI